MQCLFVLRVFVFITCVVFILCVDQHIGCWQVRPQGQRPESGHWHSSRYPSCVFVGVLDNVKLTSWGMIKTVMVSTPLLSLSTYRHYICLHPTDPMCSLICVCHGGLTGVDRLGNDEDCDGVHTSTLTLCLPSLHLPPSN